MGPDVTCQRRFRRFLALFLRVVVSLIRFHNSPGESFRFTTSSALVAQNAAAPPDSPPPAIGDCAPRSLLLFFFDLIEGFFLVDPSAAEEV